MKNVNYLIGSENITTSPLVTYNDEVCKFLNDLSSEIIKSSISRVYPDLSAVAFWARKASIHKLKEKFGDTSNRTGRGLCFHIAPSNIPVNFAFSYFFSLLTGNANIVRLPSKDSPQT
ncbi:acyl-CoA reductase, partial [bacterium]|nr:acyl-CoA reductase [bacterium]